MPRATLIIPRVAMNGAMPTRVTSIPLRNPARVPEPRSASRVRLGGAPASAAAAPTQAVIPTSAPTERSMPAVMMISPSPTARMAMRENWRRMLRTLRTVRKYGLAKVIATQSPMSAIPTLTSGLARKALRPVPPRTALPVGGGARLGPGPLVLGRGLEHGGHLRSGSVGEGAALGGPRRSSPPPVTCTGAAGGRTS